MKSEDMVGRSFGRLTVIGTGSLDESTKGNRRSTVICECSCGTIKKLKCNTLLTGNTQSCGCLALDTRTTHGMSSHELYPTFNAMKNRCNRQTHSEYKHYGAKGVKVCDRWMEIMPQGFLNFLADMGERPSKQHSIDRIDFLGNYEPSNCRWATKLEQNINRGVDKRNKAGKTGVVKCKTKGKWKAQIRFQGELYHLGTFDDLDSAIQARIAAELKYFGVRSST